MKKSVLGLSLLWLSNYALAEDPVVTDSNKYQVVFQNERVRVMEYRDKPGDKTNRHNHPDSIVYALSPFKRKLILGNGKELVVQKNEGETYWVAAQSHVGENIGITDTHVIIVELQEIDESK
ncbi:hypothetical protein [Psychromonas sp.]|uniref:hypothetical protein n=1 Tax=Psychromonas sp. TaxID=1884585 RepID=UPI0035617AC0